MNDPQRHEEIGRLFDAALEVPTADRENFLLSACGEDTELFASVQRLLANHLDSGTFLEPLFERKGPQNILKALVTHGLPPDTVGPYRILKPLGEGGMGTVYLAHQEHPIRRDVALKVIKPGMDSGSVIARFDSERRSLALMDHPNIAQVFDAGTTSTGLPYFAMEVVDGVPITQYCSAHNLDIRERIELFIPVCQAIHHAHQKGVIHRDIKPSNVLVKVAEGKAVPKVIDFGLAKAIGSGLGEDTLLTNLGTVVGTLQYMSPEQAAMDPHDVDTRSDIYSLGALLYELLTGSPPLDAARIAKDNYLAILQRIREEEPQTPNARLRESAAARPLDSELDWIPLKALEKDRSRRYETVNGLVQDLVRYLAGEPVEAAPPSRVYRLAKFVRRHRPWIAATAAFAVLLIAGAAFSAWMAVRATRATRESRAIAEFLQRDLLGQADPDQQAKSAGLVDPKLTVRTAVDRAAAKLEGRFADQPQVEAALRQTIGGVYTGLGLLKQSQVHLRRAVEMRTALHGDQAEATIDAQEALAWNLTNSGDSPGAEALLEKALQASRRTNGDKHRLTLRLIDTLGWVKYTLGKMAEAIPMLEAAEKAAIQSYGPHDRDTANLQRELFVNLSAKADYPAAERALKRARETRRLLDGAHTNPFSTDFAELYSRQGLIKEAGDEYLKELNEVRRVYGLPHPWTLISIYNLAANYTSQGRYAEAEVLFRENYRHRVAIYKPDHPRTLLFMSTWANFHTVQDKLAEADAIYAGYLPMLYKTLGGDHPTTMNSHSGLAELRRRQKRFTEAESILTKNVESMRRTYGPENPETFEEMASLARVLISRGRYADAEPVARATAEGLAKADPNRWVLFHARSLLGASLAGQRKDAEAEPLLLSGYEGLQNRKAQIHASDQKIVTEAKQRLGEFQKRQARSGGN